MSKVENENTKEIITYPVFKKSKANGDVVCFISSNKGTVVSSKIYDEGHYSDDWISATESYNWEDYTPEELNKEKVVFEWMYKLKDAWFVDDTLHTEDGAVKLYNGYTSEFKKTGRSFVVEV